MKRILAFLCVLAMMLSVVNPAAFAAENDLQAAIDAGTEEILVLEADASDITVNRDTTIDLNGHNIDGVTVLAGTLYCLDSATADYTVADGIYGKVTNVTGAVQAAEGYLQVGESFHAVNLDIYAMTLRAADVGVYYKSNFAADEVVAELVESFGVALSVVTAPNAENLETYCGYSVFTGFEAGKGANSVGTSTLLKGIMKASNGDNKNAKNAAMPVYGRAYIKTAEGYFFGETVKRSLQEQVEAVDAVWEKLSDKQKTPVLEMLEGYASVMNNWDIPNIMGIQTPGADGEIEIPIEVTAANGIVTETVTVEQGAVSITIPAGVKLVEGADKLTLTVTPKETSDAGLTLDKSEVLMPMDVHVEGVAADNTVPMTIYLGKMMAENLNMGNYTVYHVENGNANEMTLIPVNAEFTAHNQYKYTLDGELTLYVANFSEFAVRSNTNNIWNGDRNYDWYNTTDTTLYIRNADQLAGFGAIVGGMAETADAVEIEQDSFEGKTVVLLADISIGDLDSENGVVFYPIGYYNSEGTYEKDPNATSGINSSVRKFKGTFDGNGNTISNFYQNTWEMKGDHYWYAPELQYYRDAFGLFGWVVGGTIKNLTVDNFSCDSEIGTTGVITAYADSTEANSVTFENIAITNCTPRVYNIGNGGIVGSAGGNSDAGVKPIILKNITVDETNTISALWGSWDVGCGGLVGRYYPDAYADAEYGISFDNCHVAATIDVYNDVCGNYQYYWYRYCGMVIGTVEKSTADGAADLTGIVATNCTVNFGDRHEYYYCEFEKNTQASYTEDYQFSRVPHSELNFTDANGDGIINESESVSVTSCTHDHTVNEDKQAVYLPFRQIFGGNHWGIKGAGLADYPAIQISDVTKGTEKFAAIFGKETVGSGATLTIGDLFEAIEDADIDTDNVQVFVSPKDPENQTNTVAGTYTANTEDWTKGTLKLSGLGEAIITITDYNFCKPTTVTVKVMPVAEVGDKQYEFLQDALDAVEDNGEVRLLTDVTAYEYLDIHTDNFGEIERSITLNLDGKTITPAADYNYKYYPLIFVGINQTVTIKGGTIVPNEYVTVGVYGSVVLEDVVIAREEGATGEEVVCIWNWGEDDDYYQDCQYQLTGSAKITGESQIVGGVVVEGPVTLGEQVDIDKLYLNTKTGYGKFILPSGYGMVKENGYYTKLHPHDENGKNGACSTCGLAYYYEKTDLAYIDSTDTVVITMTKGNTTWALTNGNGTTAAPTATVITVDASNRISSDVVDTLKWNISSSNDGLTIYPNGDTAQWLYCTNANNGVRVGTNTNNLFTIAENGYLEHVETERYVGVYVENPDWRCYDNTDNNIKDQALAFYVLKSNCQHNNEDTKEKREAVAATCTVAGREAGVYCLDCDTYIENGKVINAKGHSYGDPKLTKEATCSEEGKYTYHCTVCNKVKTSKIDKLAHTEVKTEAKPATCKETGLTEGKQCSVCGTVTVAQEIVPITNEHPDKDADQICDVCDKEIESAEPEQPETSGSFVKKELNEIQANDIVVITMTTSGGTVYAMTNNNGTNSPDAYTVTVTDNKITSDVTDELKWNISNSNGDLTIYPNGTMDTWLYCTNANAGVCVGTNTNKVFNIDSSSGYLKHKGTSRYLGVYTTKPDWRCYTNTTGNTAGQTLAFYVWTIECEHNYDSIETTAPTCTKPGYTTKICSKCDYVEIETTENALGHSYESEVTTEATCTEKGEMTYTCANCNDSYTEEIGATGHSYVDGTCSVCSAEMAAKQTVTMNIYGTTGAIASDSSSISWIDNGVTFINKKGSTAIRTSDSDHYRLYQNSTVTVSTGSGSITKIVFTCTSSSYAEGLKAAIVVGGAITAVEQDGAVITVTLNGLTNSFTSNSITKQARIKKIEVTYIEG